MNALPELEPKHLVVVGGGVAGLVAALDCAKVGIRVTLVEASDRLGGAVAGEMVAGIRVDTGAESFATRGGHVRALVDELGLADALQKPSAAGAWVHLADGRSEPLPKAGLLGIPAVPLASDVVRVIGWRGALRAYLDRLAPVLKIGQERNLGRLVERRMGRAVLDSLVAPVTRGVYSAEPGDLDVARAAPGLNQRITTAGSLSGAVAALRSNVPAGSAVEGIDGGMHRFVDALEAELRSRGVEIVLGAAVTALSRGVGEEPDSPAGAVASETTLAPFGAVASDAPPPPEGAEREDASADADAGTRGWRVVLADGQELDADVVLVAAPERQALELLREHAAELAAEEPVAAPEVEIVTLVLDNEALDRDPRGTGVLVAGSRNGSVAAKAMTHSTAKWQWLRERVQAQHPHRHVVRVSYGTHGAANPLDGKSSHEVRARAVADAGVLLGIELADADVVGIARTSWSGTLAGATIGQRDRAERIRSAAHGVGDLEVSGAWIAGTGLASVVPDALEAAKRIRRRVLDAYREDNPDLMPHLDET